MYSKSCDVYSFGVVLAQILTGLEDPSKAKHRVCGRSRDAQDDWWEQVLDDCMPGPKPFTVVKAVLALCRECLCTLDENRPTIESVTARLNDLLSSWCDTEEISRILLDYGDLKVSQHAKGYTDSAACK